MANTESMTFGLVSKPVKKYRVEIRYVDPRNVLNVRDNKFITVQATDLTALRRELLLKYGHTPSIEAWVEDDKGKVGELDMAFPGSAPVWMSARDRRQGTVVAPNGRLAPNAVHAYFDFTKYSAVGIPIYKIYYYRGWDTYDVLGRKFNGEWVFGRDYDLKTGVWQGGTYRMDLNDLYKRVDTNLPRAYIDNKRGPTGRF